MSEVAVISKEEGLGKILNSASDLEVCEQDHKMIGNEIRINEMDRMVGVFWLS